SKLDFDLEYYLKGDLKTSELYKESPFRIYPDTLYENAFFAQNIVIEFEGSASYTLSYDLNEKSESAVYAPGEPVSNALGIFTLQWNEGIDTSVFNDPEYDRKTYVIKFRDPVALVTYYMAALQVASPNANASMLELSLEHSVTRKGVDYLNTLMDVYIKNDIEQKNQMAKNTLEFIDGQIQLISADIVEIEGELEAYKSQQGVTDIGAKAANIMENIRNMDYELSQAEIKIGFVDYLNNYVKQGKEMNQVAPSSIGIDDPLLIRLINRISELEEERRNRLVDLDQNNPAIKIIDKEISDTRKELIENIGSIRSGLEARREKTRQALSRFESQIKTIPGAQRDILAINRQFEVKEGLYEFLLEKRAETQIALASSVSDNIIVDEARPTMRPIKPVKSKINAIALLIGILFPVLLIYLKETLNDKISDRGSLEKLSKVPVVGIIPFNEDDDNLIIREKPQSVIAESFRTLRTNLQYLAADTMGVTLITSSVGTEGKTFSAMNLASVFAISEQKTLLIGFDMRKPKIVDDFGLDNQKGLSTFLAGSAGMEEIIQNSGIDPCMDVIPSGPVPPNPAELIMNKRMDELMHYLRERYKHIIIDSPPVGLVTDGFLLAKYADTTLFIVRQGITRKQHIKHINRMCADGKFPKPGLVFNAVKSRGAEYAYSYGYGYGYYGRERKGIGAKLRKRFRA
ncbi:MAG: GumC family protein, partial [Flavobacteriales bacterium]